MRSTIILAAFAAIFYAFFGLVSTAEAGQSCKKGHRYDLAQKTCVEIVKRKAQQQDDAVRGGPQWGSGQRVGLCPGLARTRRQRQALPRLRRTGRERKGDGGVCQMLSATPGGYEQVAAVRRSWICASIPGRARRPVEKTAGLRLVRMAAAGHCPAAAQMNIMDVGDETKVSSSLSGMIRWY